MPLPSTSPTKAVRTFAKARQAAALGGEVQREALFDSFALASSREAALLDDADETEATTPRQAERFVPVQATTTLVDNKGKRHRGRIINFSATGVAVEADFTTIPADSLTHVGSMRVRAGRPMRHGMVFVFEKPLDPSRCNSNTVL